MTPQIPDVKRSLKMDPANVKRRARKAANPELAREMEKRRRERLLAMAEFKHGRGGYNNHRCRCLICTEAERTYRVNKARGPEKQARQRKYRQAQQARFKEGTLVIPQEKHGGSAAYRIGCRCELCRAFEASYNKAHPGDLERGRARRRARISKREKTEPGFRMKRKLSRFIRKKLAKAGARKSTRTLTLVGCTIDELRSHLSRQMAPGMSWDNYGSAWHIDHIRPCASFDLSDRSQQLLCFHYSNLQPLWDAINGEKADQSWGPDDLTYAVAMTPYPS